MRFMPASEKDKPDTRRIRLMVSSYMAQNAVKVGQRYEREHIFRLDRNNGDTLAVRLSDDEAERVVVALMLGVGAARRRELIESFTGGRGRAFETLGESTPEEAEEPEPAKPPPY